jgi:hypothetical protein
VSVYYTYLAPGSPSTPPQLWRGEKTSMTREIWRRCSSYLLVPFLSVPVSLKWNWDLKKKVQYLFFFSIRAIPGWYHIMRSLPSTGLFHPSLLLNPSDLFICSPFIFSHLLLHPPPYKWQNITAFPNHKKNVQIRVLFDREFMSFAYLKILGGLNIYFLTFNPYYGYN